MLCPSQVQVPTAFGGITLGPSAFDQSSSGMGIPGCGTRPLPASLGTGGFRGDQTQALHEFSWGINACQVTNVGHPGHGHGAWHAAQGLKGVDDRMPAPRFALGLECLVEPLESCGLLMNRGDIVLPDEVLSWGGADDFREPPEGGRAPGGPARGAAIVSEPEGLETARGGVKITDGVCTCPGEIPDGLLCHRGDRDDGEITRAGQPGQLHGLSAVGCDPIAWFLGAQRGGHPPAVVAFVRQIAVAPVATGAGCLDEEQRCGLRGHCADEVIDVTLAGATSAERGDLRPMILSHIGDRTRVFVDIHADVQRARLGHG